MRLLLIEDSERLRRHLGEGLRKAGYEVDCSEEGREGLWRAQSNDYAVIILDLMLPGMDGLAILGSLRKAGSQAGVLILTARGQLNDRVQGLRAGADDYLTKPFAFDELAARIEAIIRRRFAIRNSMLSVRGLSIDVAGRAVTRKGQTIELTAREYALLEFLAIHRGRVFSRSEIEERVRDNASEINSNVVDATVYSVRRKIDLPGEESIITTRRGMGYAIASEDACPSGGA
jgi:DNA-binding response OmpR family regulator